ncbi:MAG TPA: pyridoxal phosphate-dependent aminotransferase [Acidimicrobiales bacterium]|nr:pyridoxal phosphate-dependent aminotransferase [Acidimicrobiales bacterium]
MTTARPVPGASDARPARPVRRASGVTAAGSAFSPPEYPYDRLADAKRLAAVHDGGVVDMSVGTPGDPPPPEVVAALGLPGDPDGAARGYPTSAGSTELRSAICGWTSRRFGVSLPEDAVAVCVGTKELVATTPQWLKLRSPERDTVLYPALSYPTYSMGALLAGLRPLAVPASEDGGMDLSSVGEEDASRALMVWVNSPGNPAGNVEDLDAVAAWGRSRGVPVFSDECYAEFTWDGPPRTVLDGGPDGVVAVHSLSKRSNMAGLRVGWYAGDPDIVSYLREVRKHAGLMVPGPVQRAAVAALADQRHVDDQRARYQARLARARSLLAAIGVDAPAPAGGFYLWAAVPGGDEWAWTSWFAEKGGALVSPGSFYGPAGAGHVRVAVVVGVERIDLVASRLGVDLGPPPALG